MEYVFGWWKAILIVGTKSPSASSSNEFSSQSVRSDNMHEA